MLTGSVRIRMANGYGQVMVKTAVFLNGLFERTSEKLKLLRLQSDYMPTADAIDVKGLDISSSRNARTS